MEGEVTSGVANSKVALGQLRLCCVERHLVPSQPAIVAKDSSAMDCGASKVKVNISIHIHIVLLVASLDLATLLSSLRGEGGVKGQLEPLGQLVLDGDLRIEDVVCVPLLCERQTIFSPFVLGLQVAADFA